MLKSKVILLASVLIGMSSCEKEYTISYTVENQSFNSLTMARLERQKLQRMRETEEANQAEKDGVPVDVAVPVPPVRAAPVAAAPVAAGNEDPTNEEMTTLLQEEIRENPHKIKSKDALLDSGDEGDSSEDDCGNVRGVPAVGEMHSPLR